MHTRRSLIALGLLTLFFGGAVGGLLGTAWIATPSAEPEAHTASPVAAPASIDPDLVRAMDELGLELRAIGTLVHAERPSQRTPAAVREVAQTDSAALIAALDRLTLALQVGQAAAASGGVRSSPLIMPLGGKRLESFVSLMELDEEERVRAHRFFTRQQVLDRFGPPDEIGPDGAWTYDLKSGEDERLCIFAFVDGYLANIWD